MREAQRGRVKPLQGAEVHDDVVITAATAPVDTLWSFESQSPRSSQPRCRSSAVGQYGLSVTTNQFRVDECAPMSDIHNQKIESDTQSREMIDRTKSIKMLLI